MTSDHDNASRRTPDSYSRPQRPAAAPALAPGRRPRTALYGAPAAPAPARPSSRAQHDSSRDSDVCKEGDPSGTPVPAPRPKRNGRGLYGSPELVPDASAKASVSAGLAPDPFGGVEVPDLILSPANLDFGDVVVGTVFHYPIDILAPAGVRCATIDAISAPDANGAMTFRTSRLAAGSVVGPDRQLTTDITCRPVTQGPMLRDLDIHGCIRLDTGAALPIQQRIRVRVNGVAPTQNGPKASNRPKPPSGNPNLIVKLPTPNPALAADADSLPTGVYAEGNAFDLKELISAFNATMFDCTIGQEVGIGVAHDHLVQRHESAPPDFGELLVALTADFIVGGVARVLTGAVVQSAELAYDVAKLPGLISDGLKTGLKSNMHQVMKSLETPELTDIPPAVYLTRLNKAVHYANHRQTIHNIGVSSELRRDPVAVGILTQAFREMDANAIDAQSLQYRAAITAWASCLAGGISSEQRQGRLSRPHLTRGSLGLLHLEVERGDVVDAHWPGVGVGVMTNLACNEGTKALRTMRPNLRIHVRDGLGVPFTFEKYYGDPLARIPSGGNPLIYLSQEYAGGRPGISDYDLAQGGATNLASSILDMRMAHVFQSVANRAMAKR